MLRKLTDTKIYDEINKICDDYQSHLDYEYAKRRNQLDSRQAENDVKLETAIGLKAKFIAAASVVATTFKSGVYDSKLQAIQNKINAITEIKNASKTLRRECDQHSLEGFKTIVSNQKSNLEVSRNNRKVKGGSTLDRLISKFFNLIEGVLNELGSSLVTGKRVSFSLFKLIDKNEEHQRQERNVNRGRRR